MMISRHSAPLRLLIVSILLELCSSFLTTKYVPAAARIPAISSNSFAFPHMRPSFRLMSTEDSMDQGETEGEVAAGEAAALMVEEDDEAEGKRGIAKTLLLTVPLFCKFVVVLLIKFVTDLVVFPLLFLYRLAATAKRKVTKKFGRQKFDKINGEQ